MNFYRWIWATLLFSSAAFAADQTPSPQQEPKPVFREPFKLEVRVDKDHVWTENFDRVPYVYENRVYLFPDEKFGARLKIEKGEIVGVTYVPDTEKADVSFEFSQQLEGSTMIAMLTMKNHTAHTLTMSALMMVPGEEKPVATSIVPIRPRLTNFESWPHALRQLMLYEIKIAK